MVELPALLELQKKYNKLPDLKAKAKLPTIYDIDQRKVDEVINEKFDDGLRSGSSGREARLHGKN
jgi:hypothetical protein